MLSLRSMSVLKEVPIGFGPRGVLPDPNDHYVYVRCEASNAVSVVDKNTWTEAKQIQVGPTPRGMSLDESTLYVTAFARTINMAPLEGNALTVIDLKTKEAVGSIKTGLGPCSVNIYDPAFYATVEDESKEVSATN